MITSYLLSTSMVTVALLLPAVIGLVYAAIVLFSDRYFVRPLIQRIHRDYTNNNLYSAPYIGAFLALIGFSLISRILIKDSYWASLSNAAITASFIGVLLFIVTIFAIRQSWITTQNIYWASYIGTILLATSLSLVSWVQSQDGIPLALIVLYIVEYAIFLALVSLPFKLYSLNLKPYKAPYALAKTLAATYAITASLLIIFYVLQPEAERERIMTDLMNGYEQLHAMVWRSR